MVPFSSLDKVRNTEHSCSIYRLCSILTVHTHFTARLPHSKHFLDFYFLGWLLRHRCMSSAGNWFRLKCVSILIRPDCRPWPAILDWWETKYNMSKSRGFPYYSPWKCWPFVYFCSKVIRVLIDRPIDGQFATEATFEWLGSVCNPPLVSWISEIFKNLESRRISIMDYKIKQKSEIPICPIYC